MLVQVNTRFKTKVLRLIDCCLSGCVFSCAGLDPKIVQHRNGVLFGYDISCVHANLLKHALQKGMCCPLILRGRIQLCTWKTVLSTCTSWYFHIVCFSRWKSNYGLTVFFYLFWEKNSLLAWNPPGNLRT